MDVYIGEIMTRMKFMNIEIDNVTMEEALMRIDYLIKIKKNAYVVTPNVDHIVQIETNSELRQVYNDANLILTDGKPLIWLSKLYGNTIKEKISGSDLFPKLCKMAELKGYSLYFLGAAPGVAIKAAENLKVKFPKLKIVGTYSPSMGFENNRNEIDKIVSDINKAQPDILIVALGCPKQELFIYRYREALNVPISLGLGATLDFVAGNIKRSPKWMSNIGLEWLYRTAQDPKRLIKRYFINDMKIFKYIPRYIRSNR